MEANFQRKLGAFQKKSLRRNSKPFSGRNQKFKGFFRPNTGDLRKKKVFAKIQSLFLAEIKHLRFIFRPKTGGLQKKKEKKKGVRRKSGVFFSASLFPRNLVLSSTGLCTFFTSHQPAHKARWGEA